MNSTGARKRARPTVFQAKRKKVRKRIALHNCHRAESLVNCCTPDTGQLGSSMFALTYHLFACAAERDRTAITANSVTSSGRWNRVGTRARLSRYFAG